MTNDEYKISCEGLSHCPQHKYGKKRWRDKDYFHCICKDQLHDTIGESCFLFCDVDSDHTCGECVHWLGDVASKGKRHEKFGSCFYRIGGIGAWWPTCCPKFVKNVDGINHYDFIEDYVFQQTGKNDSSSECREARMAARELWRQKYE